MFAKMYAYTGICILAIIINLVHVDSSPLVLNPSKSHKNQYLTALFPLRYQYANTNNQECDEYPSRLACRYSYKHLMKNYRPASSNSTQTKLDKYSKESTILKIIQDMESKIPSQSSNTNTTTTIIPTISAYAQNQTSRHDYESINSKGTNYKISPESSLSSNPPYFEQAAKLNTTISVPSPAPSSPSYEEQSVGLSTSERKSYVGLNRTIVYTTITQTTATKFNFTYKDVSLSNSSSTPSYEPKEILQTTPRGTSNAFNISTSSTPYQNKLIEDPKLQPPSTTPNVEQVKLETVDFDEYDATKESALEHVYTSDYELIGLPIHFKDAKLDPVKALLGI